MFECFRLVTIQDSALGSSLNTQSTANKMAEVDLVKLVLLVMKPAPYGFGPILVIDLKFLTGSDAPRLLAHDLPSVGRYYEPDVFRNRRHCLTGCTGTSGCPLLSCVRQH